MRRNDIRSSQLESTSHNGVSQGVTTTAMTEQDATTFNSRSMTLGQQPHQPTHMSYTSDDIDSVYMPWMMENYGRKLAIEALKRRGNMCGESSCQTTLSAPRHTINTQKQKQQSNQLQTKPPICQQHKQQASLRHRTKSPYLSQYYAQTNDVQTSVSSSTIRPNDIWLIDRGIRRRLKRSARQIKPTQMTFDENQSDEVCF